MHSTKLKWFKHIRHTSENWELHFCDGFGVDQVLVYQKDKAAICSCKSGNGICIHIQLLPHSIDIENFPISETPIDSASEITNKSGRREDRVIKLNRALEELELWLEDILSRGLAAQIQENTRFAEAVAIRMADASLTSLNRRILRLQEATLEALHQNQPLPTSWIDLLILKKAGRQQGMLPDLLWEDLCQALGINYRKEEVRSAGIRIEDMYTVVGVEKINIEPRLNQRTTWLYANQRKSWHSVIEYEFEGSTWLSAPLPIGFNFSSIAYAYPSPNATRLLFESIPDERTLAETPDIAAYTNLKDAIDYHTKQLIKLPWQNESPILLDAVSLQSVNNQWFVRDKSGAALEIESKTSHPHLQEYAASGGAPCRMFGLIHSHGFRPVSRL